MKRVKPKQKSVPLKLVPSIAEGRVSEGYIYALLNSTMPGVVKIGKTTRLPEDRAVELSDFSGVPTPFVVSAKWSTCDINMAERRIHEKLAYLRVSSEREFFRGDLKSDIEPTIEEICRSISKTEKKNGKNGTPPYRSEESIGPGLGPGRPKKTLTRIQVVQLEALAAYLTLDQISAYFGISHMTLLKIREEQPEIDLVYKRGRVRAISDVAESLLARCRAGNIAAICFYLKTQANWRETSNLEVVGKDGGPIQTHAATFNFNFDLKDFNDEELRVMEKLGLGKALPPATDSSPANGAGNGEIH